MNSQINEQEAFESSIVDCLLCLFKMRSYNLLNFLDYIFLQCRYKIIGSITSSDRTFIFNANKNKQQGSKQ